MIFFIILYGLLELVYIISTFMLTIRIIKNRNHVSINKNLLWSTIFFLSFCILGYFGHKGLIVDYIGTLPSKIFLFSEIVYLFLISSICLKQAKTKIFLAVLMLLATALYIYLIRRNTGTSGYDSLFALESLIASSIAFAYFSQLKDKIDVKPIMDDPVTLIMLGLFFCYSLPFAYNFAMALVDYFNPDFLLNIRSSITDLFLLATVSRIGTICYLVFNIFLFKAFKCPQSNQVGI